MQIPQLTLNIKPKEGITFENFIAGKNTVLIPSIKESDTSLYLWGDAGFGKTHLLTAACHEASKKKLQSVYLPLKNHEQFPPEILQDLEFQSLVCLDDIDAVMGSPEWEKALFHFYNRAFAQKTRLIISANQPAQNLDCTLPDLQSRLCAKPIFHLKPLSDSEKSLVLQQKAMDRGLTLPDEVSEYLLNRFTRNLAELVKLLDQLDQATLASKKKLTIPFIRTYHQTVFSDEKIAS